VLVAVSAITGYFALSHTVKSSGANPVPVGDTYKKGLYFASKGTTAALEQSIQQFEEALRINPASLAQVYAFVGDTEQAFNALEEAFHDHTIDVAVLQLSPVFDTLRTDARYETLLRRLGHETQPK
jgi:hypothetical protein